MFGGHWYSASEDIVIEGSWDIMGGSSSLYVTKFVGHRHCDDGDKLFLLCNVIPLGQWVT